MPAETHRQACDASIARAFDRHAAEIAAGGPQGIGRRMHLEFSAAHLRGVADMLDSGGPHDQVWIQIARAHAGALTAFLMTLNQGDAVAAAADLPEALASIREMALLRLSDPAEWDDRSAGPAEPLS